MREIKNSGVLWLGQIPKTWQIKRVKSFFIERNEKGNASNLELLTPSQKFGVVPQSKYQEITGSKPVQIGENADLSQFKTVHSGDFCISLSSYMGGFEYSEYEGVISPAYKAFYCTEKIDKDYYKHLFKSEGFIALINLITPVSVRVGRNTPFDKFAVEYLPYPELEEQKAISSYLDRECKRIDKLIINQEAQIEKLNAYKQSLVTETVTRGTNPNVQMKKSGSAWFDYIPSDWDVVRIKYLMTDIVDCPHETPDYCSDGSYYVIRTADQDYAALRSDDEMYRLSEDEYRQRIRRMSLDKDDIVYGREGGRWGLACVVPENGKYCLGQRIMQLRCNTKKIEPLFAMYALSSAYTHLQGEIDTMGSASPHVNISTVCNYEIALPNVEKQKEIVRYLQGKLDIIYRLIDIKQQKIEKLNQYKKSLIYEYVTGKKEVI